METKLTSDAIVTKLTLLPKVLSYRVGDIKTEYRLRIGTTEDGYEAYYYDGSIISPNFIYRVESKGICKLITTLYEKLLANGDICARPTMEKCENFPNETETETCVKIHNADNTATRLNY